MSNKYKTFLLGHQVKSNRGTVSADGSSVPVQHLFFEFMIPDYRILLLGYRFPVAGYRFLSGFQTNSNYICIN